jgi:hypothetical protein
MAKMSLTYPFRTPVDLLRQAKFIDIQAAE